MTMIARWIAVWLAASIAAAHADVAADDSDDCGVIQIPADDGALTRAERIALLDQALLDSLNTPCPPVEAVGGGGGSGGAPSDGVEGEQGDAAAAAAAVAAAVAASDIQGEGESEGAKPQSTAADAANDLARADPNQASSAQRAGDDDNGKIPEDIPPAANDDIIAKQFRAAAIEETDPVVKAKLWNEYRRYKGLPMKKAPPPNAEAKDAGTETAEAKSKP